MSANSEQKLVTMAENYYLDLRGSFDESIDKVCSEYRNLSQQHSSEPEPEPSSSSPPDPAVTAILTSSEQKSEEITNTNTNTWTNTFDSNMTDTSVEEPKYAKVTHKKRNSKICSGNSTPKVKRRELSGTKLSRENSGKFEGTNLLQHQAPPTNSVTPLPLATHPPSENIITSEHVEETEANTTITDKMVDVQNSKENSSDWCQKILSILYGQTLLLIGIVLPLLTYTANIDKSFSELFYIYLLLCSILYLIFVQIDLMCLKTRQAFVNHKRKKSLLTVKESLGDSGRSSKSSEGQTQQLLASPSQFLQENSLNLVASSQPQQFGSFYLRLGTVMFGVGGIIYVGIEMGGLFTLGLHSNRLITCGEIFNILRPSLQIIFIFMQMHFIFLSHKMNVFRRPLVTRLGLMQLVVTNLSIWLRAMITETMEAGHSEAGERLARSVENVTESDEEGNLICDGAVIFSLSRLTSPYLYPCLVQYSLICVAVLITMWTRVSSEHGQLRRRDKVYSSACHRYSVDCNGSHAGLFCGILMVVLTIVSVILTFVFSNVTHNELPLSDLVHSISDLLLYSIALVAVLVGTCQMRSLAYDTSVSNFLSKLILISTQSGVLLFAVSSALFCDYKKVESLLSLASHLLIILQTLLQTLFITDASHRSVFTSGQLRRKPGRQVVSFLLVLNLTLWVVNIIHTSQSQLSLQEPQRWFWPIIMHFSLPLCILYRFFSAVNLYDIWSKSFQFRSADVAVEYI